MREPVAVTGIGVVSAFGVSRATFCDALLRGGSGISGITRFDATRCRTQVLASVTDFDATRWIAPMKLRRMDQTGSFALVAVQEALADAAMPAADPGRTGVVLGTYTAGGQTSYEYLEGLHRGGPSGAPALLFHSTVGNAAASLAAMEFSLRGPNVTVSQKEASGLAAVAEASVLLREGRADVVVAGGVDAAFDVFFRVHDRFNVMSPGTTATAVSCPFDRRRNGFVMGEGAFALVMARPGATAPGQRIYGHVLGVGTASAAVDLNAWPDDPRSIVRTMELAIDDAGLQPGDIDVVFAAANSTPQLDRVEAAALATLLQRATLVTSVKGAIGECGAAGAASCAAALLCAELGQVPPIAGLAVADDCAATLNLVRTATPWPGPIVLVNSIGSGGSLASVVMRVGAAGGA